MQNAFEAGQSAEKSEAEELDAQEQKEEQFRMRKCVQGYAEQALDYLNHGAAYVHNDAVQKHLEAVVELVKLSDKEKAEAAAI